jgi:hypothetical protein
MAGAEGEVFLARLSWPGIESAIAADPEPPSSFPANMERAAPGLAGEIALSGLLDKGCVRSRRTHHR